MPRDTDQHLLTTSQIVGFLGAGLVFTTSSVNSLVYSSDGAHEAAAAGFILLSMVAVCPSQSRYKLFISDTTADCLDLLLRLPTYRLSQTRHRLFCPPQRWPRSFAHIPPGPTLDLSPRNIHFTTTSDVHLCPTQWI